MPGRVAAELPSCHILEVFERTTDGFRDVMTAAMLSSRAAGHTDIGTGHIFIGLLTVPTDASAALAPFAVDVDRIRGLVSAARPQAPTASTPETRARFASTARRAIEQALREAMNLGHGHVGGTHLLLALTRSDPTLFADLGLDACAIADAATEHARNAAPENPGILPQLGSPPFRASIASVTTGIACTIARFVIACVFVGLAGGPTGWMVAVVAGAFTAVMALALVLVAPLRRERLRARLSGGFAPTPAGDLAEALAPWRIRELAIFVRPASGRRPNAAAGAGRSGFIRVTPQVMVMRSGPFVLAHECAHLAHRDSFRLGLARVGAIYLTIFGLLSLNPTVAVVSLAAAALFAVANHWAVELSADRFATRWIGRPTARDGFDVLFAASRADRRSSVGRHIALPSWWTHPPLRLRRHLVNSPRNASPRRPDQKHG